jgi:hypothetical protein
MTGLWRQSWRVLLEVVPQPIGPEVSFLLASLCTSFLLVLLGWNRLPAAGRTLAFQVRALQR